MNNLLTKHPLSTIIVFFIWILCFIPIPQTPLDEISLIDKWTHIVMYLSLSIVIIVEFIVVFKKETKDCDFSTIVKGVITKKHFALSFLFPVIMGGVIEILQANCTNGTRSGDWFDFIADAVGVLLAHVICIPLVLFLSKKNKD